MGYTRFNKVVGQAGLYVGANGSEVQVIDSNGLAVASTETIAAAGALSVSTAVSKLALVGAGAVTLAAPTVPGLVKVIEMTVDNGDVTLALTNCAGGSAATTCTWSAVGQALVLVAGLTKWAIVSEAGVALT
jgi:hypothetical protein